MATEDTLIRFKTDAWKAGATVATYAQRMHENRGTNRLKNHVEVALCRENVVGNRILDVGIGTGRGSLPLARAGYAVTGIDISQAMLEQCRREAEGAPIELIAGDLAALPVADESFDSLISLNVAVHFPNWRAALEDWARAVKSGGRLVFDVHSQDHMNAVAAHRGCKPHELLTPQQRDDPNYFMLRLTAHDVAEAAEELDLSVVALIPYAAMLGGGNVNYWLRDARLWGYLGDRALSWMALDDRLFSFGTFIEQALVSRLSTHATGRFMIVLEKRPDTAATEAVLAYHAALAQIFEGGASMEQLRALIGTSVDGWAEELRGHLLYPANRTLLAMMLSSPAALALRPLVEELAGSDAAAELFDANARARIDDDAYRFVKTWHRELIDPAHLQYNGVDLGPSLDYDLMRNVLAAEYFSPGTAR